MSPRDQRRRKFSDVGFMLGGRCGSLAVGASPGDAYTDGGLGDGPWGWLSAPTGPRRQPPEKISGTIAIMSSAWYNLSMFGSLRAREAAEFTLRHSLFNIPLACLLYPSFTCCGLIISILAHFATEIPIFSAQFPASKPWFLLLPQFRNLLPKNRKLLWNLTKHRNTKMI